ncbi:MAG: substrate-binding domain-containing protein [Nitrospirota bacterium]|nr:substrate-binding domain-containing protein [Nitrospirota bacterium]
MQYVRKNLLAGIAALLLVAVPFSGPAMAADAAKEVIKISVDPCTQPLAEELAYAFSTKTKTKFQITQGKCKIGVDAARNEEATMGMTTQNIAELEPGLTKTVIAKAPIVFIVNRDNPVSNLTSKQLHDILNGDVENWKQVGGKDEEIHNVMLEPCVKETVARQMLDAPGYPDVKMLVPDVKFNAVKDTNKSVERHAGAIGQQIYGYESKNVKVLTIDGMLPTPGLVPAKYRLYEDYNIITKGEPKGAASEFIKFALSPEGQKIAEGLKHIPVK